MKDKNQKKLRISTSTSIEALIDLFISTQVDPTKHQVIDYDYHSTNINQNIIRVNIDVIEVEGKTRGFDLGHNCKGKFEVGDKVKTRGDFGGFELKVKEIHNNHYATCVDKDGEERHINMNILKGID